jgi:hypothetical protein
MNQGQAFYLGDRVIFTAAVINPHSRQMEYLIAYDGKAMWVRQHELDFIVYYVA